MVDKAYRPNKRPHVAATEVFCREEDTVDIDIKLTDEVNVDIDIKLTDKFTASCSSLPIDGHVVHVGPHGRLRLPQITLPRVQRDHTEVETQQRDHTEAETLQTRVIQEHRLVLEPSVSNRMYTMPISFTIKVQAGSYPVSMKYSNAWDIYSSDEIIQVNLPDRGGAVATRAPKVCIVAADGSDYSSNEADPIHLQWFPVVLDNEMLDYIPPELPSLPISTSADVVAHSILVENLGPIVSREIDGETVLHLPHLAGQWRMDASISGIPEPVAIATFLVKAARPTHIVLSHFDEDGRPLAMLPGFVVLPSSSSQNDIDMVKLRGWLADRAKADIGLSVKLCVRLTPTLWPEGNQLVEPLVLNTHSCRAGNIFKFIPRNTISDIIVNYEEMIGAERLQEMLRHRNLSYDIYLTVACGESRVEDAKISELILTTVIRIVA